MPRQPRDANLQNRDTRSKLKPRKQPYSKCIVPGLHLGYRRTTANAAGTWIAKQLRKGEKLYSEKAFALADDYIESDGASVLSYKEAFKRIQELVAEYEGQSQPEAVFYTVEQCLDDYWTWYSASREATRTAQHRSKVERIKVSPLLRGKLVADLTSQEIEKWHHSLIKQTPTRGNGRQLGTKDKPVPEAGSPDYANYLRRRKTTANSYLSVLKSALNRSWRQGLVKSNTAWSRVRPFPNVNEARIRFLTLDEIQRFLRACPPAFKCIVEGALATGARFGELSRLKVEDYLPDAQCVVFPATVTKNGKSRSVPLTVDGVEFFDAVCAGRRGGETLFLKANGRAWVRSEQNPHMRRACKTAQIEPAIGFHILRHTYASHLTQAGAPLQVVSAVLGHSDGRLTEKHYSHLSPSFIADAVRASLPRFGADQQKIIPISRGRRT